MTCVLMCLLPYAVSLFALTDPSQVQHTVPRTPSDPALRAELLEREEADQKARRAWLEWSRKTGADVAPCKSGPLILREMRHIDSDNRAWLKRVIAKRGWPGRRLVGDDGAHAAWLLVQHADADRPFQERCLKLMSAAAERGEASKTDLAYLVDRVLVGEGKKQRHGTQVRIVGGDAEVDPIEDEANVDKRRARMGMPPLAEYLELVRKMYLSGTNSAPASPPGGK